jgi:hypothetical protein
LLLLNCCACALGVLREKVKKMRSAPTSFDDLASVGAEFLD